MGSRSLGFGEFREFRESTAYQVDDHPPQVWGTSVQDLGH